MNVILLTRVSSTTDRQDVDRQITELSQFCERMDWQVVDAIRAKVSATKVRIALRTDIKALVSAVETHKPHKVVVTEISRAARDPRELDWIIDYLRSENVSLFLKNFKVESIPDEASQVGVSSLVFAVVKELAKMETDQLSLRIKSGQEHARRQGRNPGRPTGSMSNEDILAKYPRVVKRLKESPGLNDGEIARLCQISVNTVAKVRKAFGSVS